MKKYWHWFLINVIAEFPITLFYHIWTIIWLFWSIQLPIPYSKTLSEGLDQIYLLAFHQSLILVLGYLIVFFLHLQLEKIKNKTVN